MAAKKRKAAVENAVAVEPALAQDGGATVDVAGKFVGQWNRLVSTTNWEKGRIICQWREALELAGAAVTEYSDEAWAQLVGGVTSQHVGRLRRVFQQFGAVYDQYDGLYWSHFQAVLDWNDAEMWLEGAILNLWSVSQMRGKRWETLGNPGDPPQEESLDGADADDAPTADGMVGSATMSPAEPQTKQKRMSDDSSDESDAADSELEARADSDAAPFDDAEPPRSPAKSRKPLAVDVDDLPTDLADAVEQFKLAIIAQRRAGWRETTPAAVIECLDALRELALAPADD
jgi:hypothetical protein